MPGHPQGHSSQDGDFWLEVDSCIAVEKQSSAPRMRHVLVPYLEAWRKFPSGLMGFAGFVGELGFSEHDRWSPR